MGTPSNGMPQPNESPETRGDPTGADNQPTDRRRNVESPRPVRESSVKRERFQNSGRDASTDRGTHHVVVPAKRPACRELTSRSAPKGGAENRSQTSCVRTRGSFAGTRSRTGTECGDRHFDAGKTRCKARLATSDTRRSLTGGGRKMTRFRSTEVGSISGWDFLTTAPF
jgi:hypothetical protein